MCALSFLYSVLILLRNSVILTNIVFVIIKYLYYNFSIRIVLTSMKCFDEVLVISTDEISDT